MVQCVIANMIGLLQFLVFLYSHRPVYSPMSNICKYRQPIKVSK